MGRIRSPGFGKNSSRIRIPGVISPPLEGLVHVGHCIREMALVTLVESHPLTICRKIGGKGKLILLLPRTAAIYLQYVDYGAASDILTVHAWNMYTQYMITLCTL
jgi:hypothetical protein